MKISNRTSTSNKSRNSRKKNERRKKEVTNLVSIIQPHHLKQHRYLKPQCQRLFFFFNHNLEHTQKPPTFVFFLSSLSCRCIEIHTCMFRRMTKKCVSPFKTLCGEEAKETGDEGLTLRTLLMTLLKENGHAGESGTVVWKIYMMVKLRCQVCVLKKDD